MEEIGQPGQPLLRRAAWPLLGVLGAVVPCAIMWGFTVDDALIPVRYARHIAAGAGYRFNVGGPVTDGVTPLPWPWLLAPFGGAGALGLLQVAKCIGLVSWTAVSATVAAVARSFPLSLALAVSLPVAAHAVSGMETGVAMALATLASVLLSSRPTHSAALAGIAASLRPEMLPWALVIGGGAAARRLQNGLLAAVPFAICVLIRLVVFGRPAPLAVMAKPSDLAHGAMYVGSALLACATPVLLVGPLWRAPRAARVLAVAFLVHVVTVLAVGGDWMPYARLLAPVAPSLVVMAAICGAHAVRAIAAIALGALIFVRAGPAGRHVGPDRARLVSEVRPQLAGAKAVAALDVGWVSAATEETIIDLAGLTDPEIAALPGGHTSKRVDPGMLLARGPDALLLYRPGRVVELRLARSELVADHFSERAFFPLGPAGYALYRRKTP